ncbi:MAG TPA: DNA gyrase inhibitor YacG [Aurantimonas sp.]|uniref:DNA gyrase inhibitor YacG n=1 Tax=Aurantimonas marianensis TaxID=2920428 RepID=A0A9X2KE27_9HYPH|nr:DNA gyrase inhibitor YacG [Aurantimonas marianensis]MCP3054011.1 DNA gyrase inhibitor YacG [Aurantimonas marianensis]
MSPGPATVTPLRPKRRCPECGRAAERDNYPFCSARCKAVDLHRWLSGSYVIPASEEEPSDPQAGEAD